MAINVSASPVSDDWAALLGRAVELAAQKATPYGVAVECALEDLGAAAAKGRPLAPYLRAAGEAGCTPSQIRDALDEVRGAGIQAPPL
jgi:hypothetical protein